MQVRNPAVLEAIAQRRPLRLNLGAGRRGRDDTFAVDLVDLPGVDIVADLNRPLSLLPDDSVGFVHSSHVFEHVDNLMGLMRELHRVCRPDAELEIIVPHFSNPNFYSDPTHRRPFGLYTFHYFCDPRWQPGRRKVQDYYTDARFRIESVRFNFDRADWLDRLLVPPVRALANRSFAALQRYERRWCRLYPVSEVRFVLTPDKSGPPPALAGATTEAAGTTVAETAAEGAAATVPGRAGRA
jgi:SAM-dependent methyltransferase